MLMTSQPRCHRYATVSKACVGTVAQSRFIATTCVADNVLYLDSSMFFSIYICD